jgi:hypothetical protein
MVFLTVFDDLGFVILLINHHLIKINKGFEEPLFDKFFSLFVAVI